jgi:Transposase DDE domain
MLSKQHFAPHSVTILGDDLYAHEPLCRQISLEIQLYFIVVAKPDSHVSLYDWLDYSAKINAIEQRQERRWNGRHHELWHYRWINQAPLTAASDALRVNWVELTITHADTAAVLYHNTWVTNHLATHGSAPQIADAGRARWKNENESHNILKKHGYHIDHNFGHGDHNLAAVLFTLNLMAFLIHTVQQLIDTPYLLLRAALKTRQTFFDDLRTLLRYQLFPSWDNLFVFMFDGLEIDCPPELLSSA